MFGETNWWEIRHNSLSTCRFIWHINEWKPNAVEKQKFVVNWIILFQKYTNYRINGKKFYNTQQKFQQQYHIYG